MKDGNRGSQEHAFQCQNMTEKFHIYNITKLGKQFKYRNAVHSKTKFDALTYCNTLQPWPESASHLLSVPGHLPYGIDVKQLLISDGAKDRSQNHANNINNTLYLIVSTVIFIMAFCSNNTI